MAQTAVVIVSHRSDAWLQPCVDSLAEHAGVQLEIVVVENGGSTTSRDVVERLGRGVRWIQTENRGFGHANNVGVEATEAPFVLFLNADTEIVAGELELLVRRFSERPRLGLVGARQVWPDGTLQYTIRRDPSVLRWLGESLGAESWPVKLGALGERELSTAAYDRVGPCDWTAGSFMLARREAIAEVGGFDEDFFLYCEEPDLCLRLRNVGWEVRHDPALTLVHHGGNEALDSRHAAQLAYSKRLYMQKHFSPPRRLVGTLVVALGYGLRALVGGRDRTRRKERRIQSRAALATVLGLRPPPFAPAPCARPREVDPDAGGGIPRRAAASITGLCPGGSSHSSSSPASGCASPRSARAS